MERKWSLHNMNEYNFKKVIANEYYIFTAKY